VANSPNQKIFFTSLAGFKSIGFKTYSTGLSVAFKL
jgi:hypothetical protein